MFDILHRIRRWLAPARAAFGTEGVNGPHCGYFVAVYAVPALDGFIAYAKIFREKPLNPWDGFAIAKYAAHGYCKDSAVRMAELRALGAIVHWNR